MELDRAYVFGDSMNDLSMFQYAKHTIAMEIMQKDWILLQSM